MEDIFQKATEYLTEKLNKHDKISEEEMRYIFFASILEKRQLSPADIRLEYPHPDMARAKVDTYINLPDFSAVIEFKYDRMSPDHPNSGVTGKAGKIFNDFYRLISFPVSYELRIFVYLTDPEMVKYRQLSELFKLRKGEALEITQKDVEEKPNTIQKSIRGDLYVGIECIWRAELPKDHIILIFKINNPKIDWDELGEMDIEDLEIVLKKLGDPEADSAYIYGDEQDLRDYIIDEHNPELFSQFHSEGQDYDYSPMHPNETVEDFYDHEDY